MTAPYKTILTLDFETRWSSKPCSWSPDEGFTLSKLTTEAYIRDPRFKAFGCCIHEYGTDKPTQWYRHEELPRIFAMYDWSKTAVLAHNSMFDVGIMSMLYGVEPCFIFDSLSMARALRGVEAGNSLMKLADAFGLPPKGNAVYSTDGLEELTPEIECELAAYCKHDVYLCEEIFTRLRMGIGQGDGLLHNPYPTKELRLIDMTLRMFTEPKLVLDVPMLEEAMADEKAKREGLLQRLGIEESTLASNIKFAAVLEELGVPAPMKKSKVTGKPALALAKSDALFQALLNGDNEDVVLLCEARLAVKSTTERTRAQRFIDIAGRGNLPVPLNYYGAKSGRYSAAKGQAINMQNMKRGSFLRNAIMAPEGYTLCVGDLSQIEPRVIAWLSDYDDLLNTFHSGEDVYSVFGAQMFGIPGLSKETHAALRQSAKSALLACSYGQGFGSFAALLLTGFLGAPPTRYDKAFAKQLGVTQEHARRFLNNEDNMKRMLDIPHTCTKEDLLVHCLATKAIVDKYRAAASPVVEFWGVCGNMIQQCLADGDEVVYKCLTFRKGEIVLPNGMSVLYPDTRRIKDSEGKMQWVYGPDAEKLYPGKIANACTQGTARVVMTDGMLRVDKRYPVLMTVHDELVCLVPDDEADTAEAWVLEQMTKEPAYMQGIPLNADVGINKRYGLAKG